MDVLAPAIMEGGGAGKKGHPYRKGKKIKLCLCTDDMILYVDKESTPKKNPLESKFSTKSQDARLIFKKLNFYSSNIMYAVNDLKRN